MYNMMKTIEQKETGPCGNFTSMYASMCDLHGLVYRDEVAWVRIFFINKLYCVLHVYYWIIFVFLLDAFCPFLTILFKTFFIGKFDYGIVL